MNRNVADEPPPNSAMNKTASSIREKQQDGMKD